MANYLISNFYFTKMLIGEIALRLLSIFGTL